jgi:hypothetical protein
VDLPQAENTWLVEALATYLSHGAPPEIIPGITPWAASTSPALPDHSYTDDATAIRRPEALIEGPAVLDGLGLLQRRYAPCRRNAGDLAAYWSQAGGHDVPTSAVDLLIRPAATPNTNAAHPS